MPHPDQVSTDSLDSVARQLGGWIDQSAAAKFRAAGQGPMAAPPNPRKSSQADAGGEAAQFDAPAAFELGESFAVYLLGAKDIEAGLLYGHDLSRLARATGRWHHQIKVGKRAVGFARCTCKGDADFEVQQIYHSELARRVDESITWLDEHEKQHPYDAKSDPVARLLVVPAYQVHAFWLCEHAEYAGSRQASSRARRRAGSRARRGEGQSRVLVIDAPPHLDGLPLNTLLGSKEFFEAFRGKEQFGGLIFTDEPRGPNSAA